MTDSTAGEALEAAGLSESQLARFQAATRSGGGCPDCVSEMAVAMHRREPWSLGLVTHFGPPFDIQNRPTNREAPLPGFEPGFPD
jgi:hypothetical protein